MRRLPIYIERRSCARQCLPAGKQTAPRIHIHGRKRVARQQHAIGRPEQRDVTWRMSRRSDPSPGGHAGNFPGLKWMQMLSQIMGVGREETGKKRDRAANGWIGWGGKGIAPWGHAL